MNEQEAREILTDMGAKFRERDGLITINPPWTMYAPGDTTVCLDGDYTKMQLLAVAELMVVKRPWPAEHSGLYPRWTCGKCKQWYHMPWVMCDCDRART